MIRLFTSLFAYLALSFCASLAHAGEWSPSDQYMMELTAQQLRDHPPQQIAGYLDHPYPLAASGAALALARKGDAALPIVQQLVTSSQPQLHADGVLVLTQILEQGPKPSTDVQRVIESAIQALEQKRVDPDLAHLTLAGLILKDKPSARRIILCMADTDFPEVRAAGLQFAVKNIKDPETCAAVARQALTRDTGSVIRHYAWAGKLAERSGEHGARCLPEAAIYLADTAHSQRGMFSDAAMTSWFELIKMHRDHPDAVKTVPGLVQCYLRLPDSDYKGWVKAEKLAIEALQSLGPDAAPLILREVEQQMPILAEINDKEIAFLQTNRKHIAEQAEGLRELAQTLKESRINENE